MDPENYSPHCTHKKHLGHMLNAVSGDSMDAQFRDPEPFEEGQTRACCLTEPGANNPLENLQATEREEGAERGREEEDETIEDDGNVEKPVPKSAIEGVDTIGVLAAFLERRRVRPAGHFAPCGDSSPLR